MMIQTVQKPKSAPSIVLTADMFANQICDEGEEARRVGELARQVIK